MKCPRCSTEIELTWKAYFKSPFSRFNCSSCQANFTLQRNAKYYIWILIWSCIFIAGSLHYLDIETMTLDKIAYLRFAVAMFILYILADKKIEEQLPTTL